MNAASVRRWMKRRRQPAADCLLDECRIFDTELQQYGYIVACVHSHGCGYERLMFMCDRNSPLGRRSNLSGHLPGGES